MIRIQPRKLRVRIELVHPEEFSRGIEVISECLTPHFVQRANPCLPVFGQYCDNRIGGYLGIVQKVRAVTGYYDLRMVCRIAQAVHQDRGSGGVQGDFGLLDSNQPGFGRVAAGPLE